MVVSGMPQRNGDRHVTEIANMAVDIRSAVNGATMTRRSGDVAIQLRIGIHTGRYIMTSSRSRDRSQLYTLSFSVSPQPNYKNIL